MSFILNLPPEIIIWVFKSLDDIDDALHFARCCKYLHCAFDPFSVRLEIFKTIITRAPHHEHDLELSQHLNLYGRISGDFYESLPIPRNPAYRKSLASGLLSPFENDVPTEIVWDIVCRWHGMRILYDLYCDCAVNEAYLNSAFPYLSEDLVPEIFEAMVSEPALPVPSGPLSVKFEEMNAHRRQQSYQRFYKAITRQWMSVEALWFVRTRTVPNAREFDKAFERTWRMWEHNPTRSISDKIDIIEVLDFVWGFLGRKPFSVPSVPNWLEVAGECDFDLDPRFPDLSNWGYFIMIVFQYLRPPHIIELLLWMWNCSRWNLNRPRFLLRLGLFDTVSGIQEVIGDSYADNFVPITTVEKDVESSFAHTQDVATLVSQWEAYRSNRWPLDTRARVFFRDPMTEEIFIEIIGKELPGQSYAI